MWNDFKNFAFKGNAFDLAVGVILGAAFSGIVTSLVNDVLKPIISFITGGVDWTNRFWPLSSAVNSPVYADAAKQGAVLGWGAFLTAIIQFLIVAFFLFLLVKFAKSLRHEAPAAPAAAPAPTTTEKLLTEIRDSLKSAPPAAAKKR